MTDLKSHAKPTVKVKPHSYQPTKAELEETVAVRKPDGSLPTPAELARGALRPMNVIEDKDAWAGRLGFSYIIPLPVQRHRNRTNSSSLAPP